LRARKNVGDQHGAAGGAVASPELPAVAAIIRVKVETVVEGNKVSIESKSAEGIAARVDIINDHGAAGRAIGFPKLAPVNGIGSDKEDQIVDHGQVAGLRIVWPWINVFDQMRAAVGAVTGP
jgi:hypothetical protein